MMGPARRASPNTKPKTAIAAIAEAAKNLATAPLLALVKVAMAHLLSSIFVHKFYHTCIGNSTYSSEASLGYLNGSA
jgi:hypothetical protein